MLNIFFNNLIYKKYRGLILCIGDLCVVILSFLLSYWARMDFNITRIGEVNLGTALIGFAIVLTVYTICFLAFKIYKSLWKYIGLVETLRIGMAVVCASAILIALVLLCSINSFYISVIFTIAPLFDEVGLAEGECSDYRCRGWRLYFIKGNFAEREDACECGRFCG